MELTTAMMIRTPTGNTLIQCPKSAFHLVNALRKIGAILKPDPITVGADGTVRVELAGGGSVTSSSGAEFYGEVRQPAAAAPASAAPAGKPAKPAAS